LVSFPIIGPDLSIFTEIMDSWWYPLRKNLLKGPSRQIGFPWTQRRMYPTNAHPTTPLQGKSNLVGWFH
jgi:hypothetical protein